MCQPPLHLMHSIWLLPGGASLTFPMAQRFIRFILALLSLVVCCAPLASDLNVIQKPSGGADYDLTVPRGMHHRIIQPGETNGPYWLDPTRTTPIIQIESGLHYLTGKGWLPSREEIQITAKGAEAREGPIKAFFQPNLNIEGAIELLTPDDKRFRSHVVAIGYYSPETGESAVIAQAKDCRAVLHPPNEIIYLNAFDGLLADVRYVYRKGSFHQDVILLEEPPAPDVYGLNDPDCRLEVWTTFDESPKPERHVNVVKGEKDPVRRARMVEPDLVDERIDFGMTQMAWGSAFFTGEEQEDQQDDKKLPLTVYKRWMEIDEKQILIEAVEFRNAKSRLERLPKREGAPEEARVTKGRRIPRASVDTASIGPESVRVAEKSYSSPGFVLDYVQVPAITNNMTFSNSPSYYVSGECVLSSNTTIQAGAMIKFAPGGSIKLSGGSLVCPTNGKAYFTSVYDPVNFDPLDTTRVPTEKVGSPMLHLYALTNGSIKNLEFRQAITAIRDYNAQTNLTIQYCTFRDCGTALYSESASGTMQNISVCNVGTLYGGNGWTIIGSATNVCDDHGGLPEVASDISVGNAVNASFGFDGDLDYFRIAIAQNGTLAIQTPSAAMDVVGYLLDSSLNVLTWQNNHPLNISQAVTPGTYYICTREGFYYTGPTDYTISTSFTPSVNPLDTDGDGLPDTWENTYFPGLSQVPSGDPDGDLTTNLEEYQNGTSPVVAQVYSEVSKSGMTASGSSDTTGWEFSGAIDFAQGDAKGWHCSGSAYGNAVEFLRLDLASAQSVGRIAYRPRAMSGDPLNGGDWNGVFRRYQIYVTDNFSAAIGDWGPPVASGEWTWPNGQETRFVTFPPKSGRFVYFRRETAYGWYSNTQPGYASAQEVWVYRPGTTTNAPPTLNTIGNLTINEDCGLQVVGLTGITAGASESQGLSVSAVSGNPSLVPNPTVSYASPGTTGSLSLTPATNSSGSATITVTVRDAGFNGIQNDSDDASFARTFVVTVLPQASLNPLVAAFDSDHANVTVSGSSATPGAVVRYTTDGTDPSSTSTNAAPTFSVAKTVKARAFASGYAPSDASTLSVTVCGGVSFSPGGHDPTQYSTGPLSVTMTAQAGATIRFKAGASGAWLSTPSGTPVAIDGIDSGNGTLQAFAYTGTTLRSAAAVSQEYSFRLAPPTSTISYAANGYTQGTMTLVAASGPASVVLRFTTNGTVPNASSSIYLSPMTLPAPTKVYARAYKTGYIPSSYSSAFVNQLPAAKLATTSGLLTSNIVVTDSVDVWLVPNFGFGNTCAEELNSNGWTTVSFSADAPNANYRGSFVGAPLATAYSSTQVNMSYGRSFTVAAWIRHLSGTSLDGIGIMNLTSSGLHITGPYVHEYGGGITYLTQPLSSGGTTAYVANEAIFSPIDPLWHANLFIPLTNFSRTLEIQLCNQPATVADIYQYTPWATNLSLRAVATNAANKSVILSIPHSGPTLPVNTVVARRYSSGQFQYLSFPSSPTSWTRYTNTTSILRAGTERAGVVILLSKDGASSAMTGAELWEGVGGDRPLLHYTLNGSGAVYSGSGTSGPVKITLNGNHEGTIKLGQRGAYYVDAPITQRTITFEVAPPLVSYTPTNASQFVVLANPATYQSELRYTVDGSDPTSASALFPGSLTLPETQTFKIRGFKANYNPSAVVGRLGVPIFSPTGGNFYNGQTVTITAAPGSSGLKVQQSNPSLVDPSTWVLGSYGTQPGFSAYGSHTSENWIEMGATPYGRLDRVWASMSADTALEADGGWTTPPLNIDNTKTYRFSVWIKKTGSTSGWSYLGPSWNSVSTLTGSTSQSPVRACPQVRRPAPALVGAGVWRGGWSRSFWGSDQIVGL